jgi:uncharacterized linocin/CFP29 family protein
MQMEYILNGQASGNLASRLMACNFDVNALRPFVGRDGRSYITMNQGGTPTAVPLINTTATLRKDEWIQLDQAVVKAAKPRLQAVGDLRSRGLQYNITNGLGTTVLQTERQSDISEAEISMDGLRETKKDRPEFDIANLPLPIISKDFQFSARQIATARNSGSPLDTSSAELAARRVAELAEQLLLGTADSYTFGGGTIYGYTNFPNSIPQVLTDPTDSAWTPATTLQEILEMRSASQAAFHYGPWVLYTSPAWDIYLDDDYSAAKGDNTLRERIAKIQGIETIRTLDYLENYDMVLVQMTSDVAREVIGMDVTTLQWEEKGGLLQNFKVMAILVPQLRVDINGNGGIVLGRPAA